MTGFVGKQQLVVTSFILFVCTIIFSTQAAAAEITVSAAMSLKAVLEELGQRYQETRGGNRLVFNFGASGDLASQIAAGAPVDLYLSAAEKDMDRLASQGLIARNTRGSIASNTVVVVVPARSKLTVASFTDLTGPGISRLVLCDPRTSPAGRYAEDVLRHAGVLDALRGSAVLAANVRQALDYVARGEVDAGMVYGTDAASRSEDVRVVITASADSHLPVTYPAAVIAGSQNTDAARDFLLFLTSPEGRPIFRKHGFSLP